MTAVRPGPKRLGCRLSGALSWRGSQRGVRRRPQCEGFAILEVVIAFTILLIVLVPTASLYNRVTNMAADGRNRVEAANLASQQIGEAEATNFATLASQVGQTITATQKNAGMTYTVAQTSEWVNEASANACGGVGNGGGEEPVLAVTETVTWADMGTTQPVVSQTDIAAPPSYYAGNFGNLAVSVTDSNNQPVVGAEVTMTNTEAPYNTVTLPTGPTGCAFGAFLKTGVYDITVNEPGYVDPNEDATATVSPVVPLGAGDTVSVPVSYAPAGVVPISYSWSAPSLTSTPVTLAAGGYPVTINNAAVRPNPTITYPAASPQTLHLWPYPSGYDIYAGGCSDNDISGQPGYRPFVVAQGETTPDTLSLYSVTMQVDLTAGEQLTSPTVTVKDKTAGCTDNTLTFSPELTAGAMTIALPRGDDYYLSVTGTVNGQQNVPGRLPRHFNPLTVGTGSVLTTVSFP
ncbi:MAG: hypothetical protein ACP5VR_04720 [Acidimicrobiales bacterium]